jgi:hypothetical protein
MHLSPVSLAPLHSPGMARGHGEPDAPDRDKDVRAHLEKFEPEGTAGGVCRLKCLPARSGAGREMRT